MPVVIDPRVFYVRIGTWGDPSVYRVLPEVGMIQQVGYIPRDGSPFRPDTTDSGHRGEFWNEAQSVHAGGSGDIWSEMVEVVPCGCPRHNGEFVMHTVGNPNNA